MNWKRQILYLAIFVAVFAGFYWLPVGEPPADASRVVKGLYESVLLAKWYAREHVLLCLVPAFFIAGGIGVFVSQASVMKYLGARANKVLAYGVASVSGTILAVCSCTVLPLFAGIYRMGAGLGPATAFLYSGPAINVLAIVLTARVLGLELGIARAVGAVIFSVVIGLLMHLIFRREETEKSAAQAHLPEPETSRPLWQNVLYFAAMVGVLVFANWGKPDQTSGAWHAIWRVKWIVTSVFAAGLALILALWFELKWSKVILAAIPAAGLAVLFPAHPALAFSAAVVGLAVISGTGSAETKEWTRSTWTFARQILPLLFFGVLVAGFLLGRPDKEAVIPRAWVAWAVGGNSLLSNLFASVAGALMYFATLTEVPIVGGLRGSGMGNGPALALLLAGPALSLPNMLVIRGVMGTKKTIVYVLLVVVMATISGVVFGSIWG